MILGNEYLKLPFEFFILLFLSLKKWQHVVYTTQFKAETYWNIFTYGVGMPWSAIILDQGGNVPLRYTRDTCTVLTTHFLLNDD